MRFHAGSRPQPAIRSLSSIAEWTYEVDFVFLVGAARSGTTWLQSMLASHPEIYSGPETHFFSTYHPVELEYWRAKDRSLGVSCYLDREAFYGMMAESFRRVLSALPEPAQPKRYFLEKSPHHCLSAEFILSAFPNARFLHLVRDPRSVTASLLRASKSWGESWAPSEVDEAVRQWIERVKAGSRCAELVADPTHFLEVRYEDLRVQTETGLCGILQFLGLQTGEDQLAEIVGDHQLVRARSQDRPFAAIAHPKSHGARQIHCPEGFIGPAPVDGRAAELDEAAMRRVEALAGSLMCEYGYRPSLVAAPASPARFSASVVLVTQGDDPEPALRTLSSMAPNWREDWELLVVEHGGCAGQRAAECLQGDFHIISCSPETPFAGVLGHAAARARGERLLLAGAGELLAVDRRRLTALAGTEHTDRRQTIQWLTQESQPVFSFDS